MKTRTATALSLIGVLAAGTAAALANTHVLSSRAESADSPSILTINSLSTPQAVDLVPATANSTRVAVETDESQGSVSTNPSPSITSYAIGDAGVVELQITSTGVDVVGVTPKSGWVTVASASSSGSNPAAVILSSGSTEVTFAAAFLDGRIVTDVSSRSLTPPPASGSAGRHHDDDDEEHDDDDHEERDGEHEDHDDDDD